MLDLKQEVMGTRKEWLDFLAEQWQHIKAQNSYHLALPNGEVLGMMIGYEVLKQMYPRASTEQLEDTKYFYLRLDGGNEWENVLVGVDKFLFPGSKVMGVYFDEPQGETNEQQAAENY